MFHSRRMRGAITEFESRCCSQYVGTFSLMVITFGHVSFIQYKFDVKHFKYLKSDKCVLFNT